uniref:Uncharacterized protein n=1 Tax=Anguilla anguilla TaxID=7936 RepID=A0A0E9XNR8_ANGAN
MIKLWGLLQGSVAVLCKIHSVFAPNSKSRLV